jgi:hypothetical protein
MPRSQKSGKDVDVVMEVDGAGEERGASGKKPKTVRKKTKTQVGPFASAPLGFSVRLLTLITGPI